MLTITLIPPNSESYSRQEKLIYLHIMQIQIKIDE